MISVEKDNKNQNYKKESQDNQNNQNKNNNSNFKKKISKYHGLKSKSRRKSAEKNTNSLKIDVVCTSELSFGSMKEEKVLITDKRSTTVDTKQYIKDNNGTEEINQKFLELFSTKRAINLEKGGKLSPSNIEKFIKTKDKAFNAFNVIITLNDYESESFSDSDNNDNSKKSDIK